MNGTSSVSLYSPNYMRHKAYIFFGSQYVKWDLDTDTFDSGPERISSRFDFAFSHVDAVMACGNVGPRHMHNKAYIFFGDQYIKWDLETNAIYSRPKDIYSNFGGHFSHVDAVMTVLGNCNFKTCDTWSMHNKAYIFSGNQYIKWDLNTDSFWSGPKNIAYEFGGRFSHVDAVMTTLGNVSPSYMRNKAYIFFGSKYITWDLNTDTYSDPKNIGPRFGGHFSHVDAVMISPDVSLDGAVGLAREMGQADAVSDTPGSKGHLSVLMAGFAGFLMGSLVLATAVKLQRARGRQVNQEPLLA